MFERTARMRKDSRRKFLVVLAEDALSLHHPSSILTFLASGPAAAVVAVRQDGVGDGVLLGHCVRVGQSEACASQRRKIAKKEGRWRAGPSAASRARSRALVGVWGRPDAVYVCVWPRAARTRGGGESNKSRD